MIIPLDTRQCLCCSHSFLGMGSQTGKGRISLSNTDSMMGIIKHIRVCVEVFLNVSRKSSYVVK